MMGRQEIWLGSALKRIVMVLLVAALMAVMMVAMAAPAFATPPPDRGGDNSGGRPAGTPGNGGGFGGLSLTNGSDKGVAKKELCGVSRNPHLSRLPGSVVC